jgi:hypothetical protein
MPDRQVSTTSANNGAVVEHWENTRLAAHLVLLGHHSPGTATTTPSFFFQPSSYSCHSACNRTSLLAPDVCPKPEQLVPAALSSQSPEEIIKIEDLEHQKR